MTNPITPDVRAAIERLRRFNQGVLDAVNSDIDLHCVRAAVADAMLALFPAGMPEPWMISRSVRDVSEPTTYCGLFIPLSRNGEISA